MNLATDLSREVAERAPQPGFDAVIDRAQGARCRRRTTIASGLAAAVVVAGVGFAASRLPSPDASPGPATPAPSTTWDGVSDLDGRLPADVQDVLRRANLHPWAVVGSGGGVAVLWQGCLAEGAADAPCDFAIVTRTGDRVSGSVVPSGTVVSAAPGGWLVQAAGATELLGTDGSRRPVVDTGPGNADSMPGDTVVETGDGPRILRGTKLVPVPSPPGSDVRAAYATPGGNLVVASDSPGERRQLSSLSPGGVWTSSQHAGASLDDEEVVATRILAGNGETVALATLADDPDGSIPVLSVQVSSDAGRTWALARGLRDVSNLSSMVVAPGGTTYVATESDGLLRIDLDGTAQQVGLPRAVMGAVVVADGVCALVDAGSIDQLQCSADDGTTWAPQPLPGFS